MQVFLQEMSDGSWSVCSSITGLEEDNFPSEEDALGYIQTEGHELSIDMSNC